ncbi:hypothetical protein JCM15548_102 [Geofilum rubicundum JCM 15548]|uniref:Uncharacterized protein n=1 Tax=Geofilum rubicundum JCM 15548 TaxID=1236989 RepID=A0A0E9LT70_9BACT|nr:hypothetical protein JCM15548_102 [Geofilum rubicundum JCM 15548]
MLIQTISFVKFLYQHYLIFKLLGLSDFTILPERPPYTAQIYYKSAKTSAFTIQKLFLNSHIHTQI